MKRAALIIVIVSICIVSFANDKLGLIPVPQKIKIEKGSLILKSETSLGFSEDVNNEFKTMCAELVRNATGWEIPIKTKGTINFVIEPNADIAEEGYKLKTSKHEAYIIASTQKGLFYGFQTLRQLMPAEAFNTQPAKNVNWKLPIVEINDAPKYQWRGILVDVSRKFQTKETIMKMIDGMAACKLNVFHWHLTDDQGWRLEIKKYPKLTEISKQFYTQEDIKEVVKYASMRNITIVPEIDIPGHSGTSGRAYPNLRCRTEDGHKATKGNTYCVGNNFSYQFLEDVLKEVVELFPGQYIHLGADEVGKGNWRKCPDCKALMEEKDIENMHDLEAYFVQKIIDIVIKLGKKAITWDEGFTVHSNKEQIIMSWRGTEPGMKAAEAGHQVIFCPVSVLYFDRENSRSKYQHRGYSINTVNLNLPYFFEPTSPLLTKEGKNNILGAEGCVWGEKIIDDKHVMMQAMMRGCALAESTWSGADKLNWPSFLKRAAIHTKRLDALGVNYFWEPMSNADQVAVLQAGTITKENGDIKIDVSKFIKKSGMHEFTFHRYSGDGTFTVTDAILLKNGKKISNDTHSYTATIDGRRPNQFYHLWETDYDPKAKYTLQFKAKVEKVDEFTAAVLLIPSLPDDEYSEWSGPMSKANGQEYKSPDIK